MFWILSEAKDLLVLLRCLKLIYFLENTFRDSKSISKVTFTGCFQLKVLHRLNFAMSKFSTFSRDKIKEVHLQKFKNFFKGCMSNIYVT